MADENKTNEQEQEKQEQENQEQSITKLQSTIDKLNSSITSFLTGTPQTKKEDKEDEKGGQSKEEDEKKSEKKADEVKDEKEDKKDELDKEKLLAELGIDKDTLSLLDELKQKKQKDELSSYVKEKTKDLGFKLPEFEAESKEQVDSYIEFAEKFYDLNKPEKVDGGVGGSGKKATEDLEKKIQKAFDDGNWQEYDRLLIEKETNQ